MSLSSRFTDSSAPTACPSCENDVLNVQGIHACSSCSWVVPEYR